MELSEGGIKEWWDSTIIEWSTSEIISTEA